MSVIKDLLLLDSKMDRSGIQDPMVKFLLKRLKKAEGADAKKKLDAKKGWTFEDRVCLGLLLAFVAPPLALFYRWVILTH